jgi:hypothetical protein
LEHFVDVALHIGIERILTNHIDNDGTLGWTYGVGTVVIVLGTGRKQHDSTYYQQKMFHVLAFLLAKLQNN